ncbi:ABC transporter permease [Corynebacterium freiburgense]|uniref:ABC transporter permease n=1 Tax=Corynebacterium freiburgense TaxID=556548 RepID=UPI000687261C|nr:ABC transporter permease [Corynebacterium freiburgense]WJZ02488.1 ABC-2 family transporter protein [Corynebacterium freiburgense]
MTLTNVQLEWLKMRRMWLFLSGLFPASAGVILVVPSLFREGNGNWPGFILQISFALALTLPIMISVLASRQTDIEHTSSGWIFAATSGISPGSLCRAKFLALAPIVAGITFMTVGGLFLLGFISELGAVTGLQHWAGYVIALIAVNLWFCAFHIVLAAWTDNQILGMGIGVLGAFISGFSLFLPQNSIAVKFIPWSYYAQIIPATFTETAEAVYIPVPWIPICIFIVVGIIAFAGITRLMDVKEW